MTKVIAFNLMDFEDNILKRFIFAAFPDKLFTKKYASSGQLNELVYGLNLSFVLSPYITYIYIQGLLHSEALLFLLKLFFCSNRKPRNVPC